jgi:general stress protein 26
MADAHEIEEKLWKSLKSDRTVMLQLVGGNESLAQPMTVQFEDGAERGPLWIFTAKDTDLVQAMGPSQSAQIQFASKGHDLFAAMEGELHPVDDPEMIDRLWSPYVEAWFEHGQSDPNLQLLRFDPERGTAWLNDNSLFAAARMLLGRDPKKDYQDKVAHLRM